MRNLIFAGNTCLVLGHESYFDRDESYYGYKETYHVAPVSATAPRTGLVVGLRVNLSSYGDVLLGRLRVGDRTIYHAVRPSDYDGMCGVDLAHPGREYRRMTPFMVEEDQVVTADLSYSGYVFDRFCSEFQYSLDLEWVYQEDVQ
jgi:hypothetical protein